MSHPVVLLVASDPFLLSLMSDLLEVNDVHTARARGVTDAVDVAHRVNPLIAIVDWDLAAHEAESVIAELRNGHHVIVVADDRRSDHRSIRALPGVADVVKKPLETSGFARAVKSSIRRLAILADA